MHRGIQFIIIITQGIILVRVVARILDSMCKFNLRSNIVNYFRLLIIVLNLNKLYIYECYINWAVYY